MIRKNAYFVQWRNDGRPLPPAHSFLATMACTTSTYRLRAAVSLNFLAIENVPKISVKLRIVDKHQV